VNFLRKVSRTLGAFAAVPLYWVEKRESERKLEERLKRLEDSASRKKPVSELSLLKKGKTNSNQKGGRQ